MIWELRDTPRFSEDEAKLLAEGWEPFHGFQIGTETWVVFRRLRADDEGPPGWAPYAPLEPEGLTPIPTEWELAESWPCCLLALGSTLLVLTLIGFLIWWLA